MFFTLESDIICTFINCFPGSWKCKGLNWYRRKIVFAQISLFWLRPLCSSPPGSPYPSFQCLTPSDMLFVWLIFLLVCLFDSPNFNERSIKAGIFMFFFYCCIFWLLIFDWLFPVPRTVPSTPERGRWRERITCWIRERILRSVLKIL